ncbi:hypothetical protein SEVIR_2G001366v4 [Setaria viridis]
MLICLHCLSLVQGFKVRDRRRRRHGADARGDGQQRAAQGSGARGDRQEQAAQGSGGDRQQVPRQGAQGSGADDGRRSCLPLPQGFKVRDRRRRRHAAQGSGADAGGDRLQQAAQGSGARGDRQEHAAQGSGADAGGDRQQVPRQAAQGSGADDGRRSSTSASTCRWPRASPTSNPCRMLLHLRRRRIEGWC